jgi:hypothetical protein
MKILQYGDTSKFFRGASYVFMIPTIDHRFTRIIRNKKEHCVYSNLVRGYFYEIISISR